MTWQSNIYFIKINVFSLSLRSEEYDLLENVYGLPDDDRVNYKRLVEEVETVFTLKVCYTQTYLFIGT